MYSVYNGYVTNIPDWFIIFYSASRFPLALLSSLWHQDKVYLAASKTPCNFNREIVLCGMWHVCEQKCYKIPSLTQDTGFASLKKKHQSQVHKLTHSHQGCPLGHWPWLVTSVTWKWLVCFCHACSCVHLALFVSTRKKETKRHSDLDSYCRY